MSMIKLLGKTNIQGKTIFETGPQAPAFAPTDISGLQLWLDASDTSTLYNATAGGSVVTTDGAAVARWADKSGNNRHATQTTANARPLLKTGIKNGRNVLRFDGTNDSLAVNSVASFFHNSHTIFAVGALSGTSAGALIGAVGFHQTIRLATTSALTEIHDPYAGSSVAYTRGTWGVFTRRLVSSSTSTLQIFNNSNAGNLISRSGAITRVVTNVNVGAADPGNGYGVAWHLNGDISEILIYNSALTTVQRQSVETYLNTKWALY